MTLIDHGIVVLKVGGKRFEEILERPSVLLWQELHLEYLSQI